MSLIAGRQEQDSINVTQVVVGFVGAVVIMVLTYIGVLRFAVTEYQPGEVNTTGVQYKPGEAPKFGMLHQTLFANFSDARELNGKVREHLESYGWVDQNKTVAHIPIERAMKLVAEGKAK